MARRVEVIPPTLDRYTSSPIDNPRKRKVAGYARVSTDLLEQLTSYAAQVDYYTKYIKSHEDWEFVKVYTDEGITGTNTKYRDGFKEMVQDALDGKIDLIITKSVSRFARNTVDTLSTIYKLREHNVECYFEKENIYSFDPKCDMLLTFLSGMAQEEARSISENTTWGQRKRFADGDVTFAYSMFLGYDKGEDGKIVINEEQAAIVRRIFGMFIKGDTYCGIARKLTEEGIPTVTGKTQWRDNIIKSMLTNEKYKGDAVLQKTYTVDFINKKVKKNNGEIPMYYVRDNHPAIIPREIFDMVQRLIEERKKNKSRISTTSIFSGKVICGDCGSTFGTKVWHSNTKYRRVILQCNNKFKNKKKCTTPHFTEAELKEMFVKAINKVLPQKAQIKEDFELIKDRLFNTAEKETELVERYTGLKGQVDTLNDEIAQTMLRKTGIENFLKIVFKRETLLTEFDGSLFDAIVDRIIVYSKDDVRFKIINGKEVRA